MPGFYFPEPSTSPAELERRKRMRELMDGYVERAQRQALDNLLIDDDVNGTEVRAGSPEGGKVVRRKLGYAD
jgi:hypothetical protein